MRRKPGRTWLGADALPAGLSRGGPGYARATRAHHKRQVFRLVGSPGFTPGSLLPRPGVRTPRDEPLLR